MNGATTTRIKCVSPKAPFLSARSHRRADPKQVQYCHPAGLGREHRVHRRPASPQHLLGDVGLPDVRHQGRRRRHDRACRLPEDLRRSLHPPLGLRREPRLGNHGCLSSSTGRRKSPASISTRQEADGRRSATRRSPTRTGKARWAALLLAGGGAQRIICSRLKPLAPGREGGSKCSADPKVSDPRERHAGHWQPT